MIAETTTAPTPIEVVTPIKPSEAIRLGCLIAPVQLAGQGYTDYEDRRRACVFGAMALGFGAEGYDVGTLAGRWHRDIDDRLIERFPVDCPASCGQFGSPMHLNDDHFWKRERIADWLEGLGL